MQTPRSLSCSLVLLALMPLSARRPPLVRSHDFGDDVMTGECVVVPCASNDAEDDAWALLFVHGRGGSATELVVLDAARFDAPPVARIRIRGRVPFGLHGDFLPRSS